MQQIQNRDYKTNDSLSHQFMQSCLGKMTIALVAIIILLILAHVNIPGEEAMLAEMTDNIYQCIEANDSTKTDDIDDAVNNLANIFTTADSLPNKEVLESYEKFNELKYYRHAFYATTRLHNNLNPYGALAGVGFFGIVIPTVNYSDLLLRTGVMHKGYDQKIIKSTAPQNEDLGVNPDLGI